MDKPKIGDYVLATEYSDGDPMDPHCVGFLEEINGEKYFVIGHNGKSYRSSGFRRCEKINQRTGDILVRAFPTISDTPGKSLWYWKENIDELELFLSDNFDQYLKDASKAVNKWPEWKQEAMSVGKYFKPVSSNEKELIDKLENLKNYMREIAYYMVRYNCQQSEEIQKHGEELTGAAQIVDNWIKSFRAEIEKDNQT